MRAWVTWLKGGVAAAAVVLAAWTGIEAEAAEYRLLKLGGQVVKWGAPTMGAGATVTYAFVRERMEFANAINCRAMAPLATSETLRQLGGDRVEAEFVAALKIWESASNVRFRPASDPTNADFLIGAQANPHGIAYANVWHQPRAGSRIATIVRGSICLNPELPWQAGIDGMDETYDIRQVAAHEIGHVIGLDHPGRTGQLMAFRYDETIAGLRPGDVQGVLQLYGVSEARQQTLTRN